MSTPIKSAEETLVDTIHYLTAKLGKELGILSDWHTQPSQDTKETVTNLGRARWILSEIKKKAFSLKKSFEALDFSSLEVPAPMGFEPSHPTKEKAVESAIYRLHAASECCRMVLMKQADIPSATGAGGTARESLGVNVMEGQQLEDRVQKLKSAWGDFSGPVQAAVDEIKRSKQSGQTDQSEPSEEEEFQSEQSEEEGSQGELSEEEGSQSEQNEEEVSQSQQSD